MRPGSLPFLRALLGLALVIACAAEAQAGIAGHYTGRYQCGEWNDFELRITDSGNNRLAGVFTFSAKGALGIAGRPSSYSLDGWYDSTTGRFRMDPRSWIGRAPAGYVMVGLDGMVEPRSQTLSGRITNLRCGRFTLASSGSDGEVALQGRRPPSRSPIVSANRNATPGNLPPERRNYPTDITGNTGYWFEYVDSSFSDPAGTIREEEPIDAVIDWLRNSDFSCVGTQRVIWNGNAGTASDQVSVIERYVIECSGNCRGVRYKPKASAIIVHFGQTQQAPVVQIKSPWLGGTDVRWEFTREDDAGKPPDIFIHRWTAGKFNSGQGCKAPKAITN